MRANLIHSFKKRLTAGGLIYAIMIALLIGLVLGSLLLLGYYHRQLQSRLYQQEVAQDLIPSVVNWTLAQPDPTKLITQGQLFESDSFYVQTESWGVYGLMNIRTVYGQAQAQASALWGSRPAEGVQQAALYMAPSRDALKLVGQTRLEGACYLPERGAMAGLINRRGYQGTQFVYGTILNSRNAQPSFDFDKLEVIQQVLGDIPPYQDTLIYPTVSIEQDSLYVPWTGPVEVLDIQGNLRLDRQTIQGKYQIQVSGKLTIGAKANLEDIVLVARCIEVEQGFQGRVQLFATDTVLLQQGTHLRYPSTVAVSGRDRATPGFLQCMGATVEGVIVNHPALRLASNPQHPRTYTSPKSEWWGMGLLAGQVEHRGKFFGHMVVNQFILHAGGGLYTNHLMDATISSKSLSKAYTGGIYLENPAKYAVIKWMHHETPLFTPSSATFR